MAGPIAGWETGHGPAVLFLHGGPGMSDYGAHFSAEAAGWRFITYQQRGVSPSTTKGPFSVEQHVTDAVTVLDELGLEEAVVVGHSWGAHLALHLAVARPDRVAGLVLVDGLGVIGDGGLMDAGKELTARLLPAAAERMPRLIEEIGDGEPSDEAAAEHLRLVWPGYYADPSTAPPPWDVQVSGAVNEATRASISDHLAAGFADSLATIQAPVIFVLGEKSPIPLSQGEQTASLVPGAEVRIIPAAGHMPNFEQPGCIADAIAAIYSRVAEPDAQAG